jgi:dTMP kinase
LTGRFITIEGGEGSGKSTFGKQLTDRLATHGVSSSFTREPGGSQEAENIRSLIVKGDVNRFDPLEEVLLLNAARRHHIRTVIQPALNKGQWLICDRFFDSTLVYQGYAKKVDLNVLNDIHSKFCFGLIPDHTFVLDVSVKVGLSRATKRLDNKEDRFEKLGEFFHSKVRNTFLQIALDSNRHTVLNTEELSVEASVEAAWLILKQYL